jgi:DNA-binding NarL/FixJ family response regulator
MAMTSAVRILLAETDRPTLAGLRLSLARAGFEIAAEVASPAAALEAALAEDPDVALIAADLPGGGIDAVRTLSELAPRLRVIVLSPQPTGEELLAAVLAGAAGYLAKDMSAERLPHAVRGVASGEVALPRRHAEHLLAALRRRDARRARVSALTGAKLTDREWEVLHLLAEGTSTAEMAGRLRISQVTVRRHVSALLAKLDVPDRKSAADLLRRSAL